MECSQCPAFLFSEDSIKVQICFGCRTGASEYIVIGIENGKTVVKKKG